MGESESADRFRSHRHRGPEGDAKAFEMEETEMSSRCIVYAAANGSNLKNYGAKKVVGCADDGERASMRAQSTDVEKVLCSVSS